MTRSLTFLALCCVASLVGCFQADESADSIPPYTAGPIDPAFLPEPMDSGAPLGDAGTLSFEVQTAPVGGRFAPRNVGAIWIESQDGQFIKTLELWAQTRARYLRRFQAASGGDTTDAITGATRPVHGTHAVSWNLTNHKRRRVGPGPYRVVIEITDKNSTGASLEVPFELGQGPFTMTPQSTPQFSEMELRLVE